jgi:hypothetical protein
MTGQIVVPAPPPAAFLRVSNPVVKFLLRTPLGGPMRGQFMVLSFTGRKTGRHYAVPVVAHRIGDDLYALTGSRWRLNFAEGKDADVTLDGRVTKMRGELLDDPEAVAPLYAGAIDHFGIKRSRRMLGLSINAPATPSREVLADAARRHGLTAIRLS